MRPKILILTIKNRLRRGFSIMEIFKDLRSLLRKTLRKQEILGYYLLIKGRFKRSSRSNKLLLKAGKISFNKVDLKMESATSEVVTRYGVAGIRIIFTY